MSESQEEQPLDDNENVSIVTEFFYFVRENKKWWLIPLVGMFAVLAVVILAGQNAALAPFIYSFF